MKKIFALLMAMACLFSLLVMPAAAQETDLLDEKFQQILGGLDFGYETYGSLAAYMIVKTNRTIFEDLFESPWEHMEEVLILQAKDYEEVLNRNFVPSAQDMELIRTVGYGDSLVYDAAEDAYTVKYPGGFGGALSLRAYLGYETTSNGFDVYYGTANYVYLSDVLPEGMDEQTYAGELGYPASLEYEGKQYENGPDGYYYLDSVDLCGMKYSLVVDNENIRISGAHAFTEEECPDSFEKLPEVDEDMLSIMGDIEALVDKYGPEIPDEVKNGTKEGTTCEYKPGENSYYVAIGDDTTLATDSYVKLLAESLGISYKDLPEKKDDKKGMLIDSADASFLEANRAEIEKADLISLGFSINGFASVAVEEVLKNKSDEDSYLNWGRYLPEEGVQEIEAVLQRMEEYLQNTGMTGTIPILNIPKTDALVVAAESFAFGTLAYINELPRLIEDIRAINPTAQIVIVGMDNPMEGSSILLSNGEKMELGVYADQLIRNMDNVSQTVAIEKENTVFVSAPDASNENDNKELSENTLILSYINGVKDKAKPDADGHAYICGQILKSMLRKGDVDGDGQVTYNDALLVLRGSIGLETISPELLPFADVDGDGEPSYNDALMILRASIGLETLN